MQRAQLIWTADFFTALVSICFPTDVPATIGRGEWGFSEPAQKFLPAFGNGWLCRRFVCLYFYVFFWDLSERRVFHLTIDWEIEVTEVPGPGVGWSALYSGKSLFYHIRTCGWKMHKKCIRDLIAVTEESYFKAIWLSKSHLFWVLMVDTFVRVKRNYCVVAV